jgi:putative pyruvate formate lyase activating enzyme
MHRQVGELKIEGGVATKGLLVRHLVLPNGIAGSRQCFEFISRQLSRKTAVNVMAQYYPTFKASDYPNVNRRIKTQEYREAIEDLARLGLDAGFRQTLDTIFRAILPEWTDDLKNA